MNSCMSNVSNAQLTGRSIVLRPLVIALWAVKEDGGAFVCTTQLLFMVANFLGTTLLTCLANHCFALHVVVVHNL